MASLKAFFCPKAHCPLKNYLRKQQTLLAQSMRAGIRTVFARPLSQQARLKHTFDIKRGDRFIEVSKGSGRAISLTYEYLLDNNAKTFEPKTFQRMDNIMDIDSNVELLSWELLDHNNLELNWSNEQSTVFDLSFLNKSSCEPPEVFWNSGQFEDLVLSQAVDANGLLGPYGKKYMDNFHRCLYKFGVAFAKNVDPSDVSFISLAFNILFADD